MGDADFAAALEPGSIRARAAAVADPEQRGAVDVAGQRGRGGQVARLPGRDGVADVEVICRGGCRADQPRAGGRCAAGNGKR